MPTPEPWRKAASEALDRENTPRPDVRPVNQNGTVTCGCGCHRFCHMCGRPFNGQMHINCGDMLQGGSIVYSKSI